LANAGIELRSGMLSARGATNVAVGVIAGLVVGKLAGIVLGAWLGVRVRLAVLPNATRWSHIAGVAALGGIGFTVSLFIAGVAFTDPALADAAKAATLTASVSAATIGAAVLLASTHRSSRPGRTQR
jgi:NhaA family Na+:H+ antiporter